MTTVDIAVRVPSSWVLTSNQRHGHWAIRARRTEQIRTLAWITWQQAGRPRLAAADAICRIDYPNSRGRDCLNLVPTVKAAVDGIVSGSGSRRGGCLLPDDSDCYLTGPDLRPTGTITPGYLTLNLTFTEREPS